MRIYNNFLSNSKTIQLLFNEFYGELRNFLNNYKEQIINNYNSNDDDADNQCLIYLYYTL